MSAKRGLAMFGAPFIVVAICAIFDLSNPQIVGGFVVGYCAGVFLWGFDGKESRS